MAILRFRVRGPNGQTTLSLDDATTVQELGHQLTEATSLLYYTIKIGTPPLPLQPFDLSAWPPDATLASTGVPLANSLLTLSSADAPSNSSKSPAPRANSDARDHTDTSSLTLQRKQSMLQDPPEIAVEEWGMTMVLRVMPDDNSCLFRALGTCLLSDEIDAATELRDIVATVILGDPTRYDTAILGMDPPEYCRKIKSPDAWGGEIEISIIAEYFGISVDAINVKDLHIYSYNQTAKQKCIIVYSGIHYDAIAMTGGGVDVKQFDSGDTALLNKAVQICSILQGRHYFTDTATFGIKCLVPGCGWVGNGEKAANDHASLTAHTAFGEQER